MNTIYFVSYEETMTNINMNSFLNFCKNRNDDDIVCLINNEKDIVDIKKKYYLYKNSIIFADQYISKNWFTRYIQKKIYKKGKIPNPYIFIGSCRNVIDFWEGIIIKHTNTTSNLLEIQLYVMNRIRNQEKSTIYDDDFIIDTEHEVFCPTYVNKIKCMELKPYVDAFTFEMNIIALSIYITIVFVAVAVTEPGIFVI
jgi:hypothetical protein